MNKESLHIILTQYRKEHLTEDEAIQLIEDLYNKNNFVTYPYYFPQQITYETSPSYEVTCKKNE